MKKVMMFLLVVLLVIPAFSVKALHESSYKQYTPIVHGFADNPHVKARYFVDVYDVSVFLTVSGTSNAYYIDVSLPFAATDVQTVRLINITNGGCLVKSTGRGLIVGNILYASPDPQGEVLWIPTLKKGFNAHFEYKIK